MPIFHYHAETDNKENYNPDLKTFSPQKLVNQKRYKVLKNIVMKNQKSPEPLPLKERVDTHKDEVEVIPSQSSESMPGEPHALGSGHALRDLAFEDETERKFGL